MKNHKSNMRLGAPNQDMASTFHSGTKSQGRIGEFKIRTSKSRPAETQGSARDTAE